MSARSSLAARRTPPRAPRPRPPRGPRSCSSPCPDSAAVDVAHSLAAELAGKVVVDCNNPLVWKEGPVWTPPAQGSLSAAIAEAAPGARVVKGFNTFGAEFHADPGLAGAPVQVFLAGDDASAKQLVSAVATASGFAPVDAGPLRNAAVLENLAILWIPPRHRRWPRPRLRLQHAGPRVALRLRTCRPRRGPPRLAPGRPPAGAWGAAGSDARGTSPSPGRRRPGPG